MLLGDNPFIGGIYIEHQITENQMLDYYTADKVVEAMFVAEKDGITGNVAIGEPFVLHSPVPSNGRQNEIDFSVYPAMNCKPI